MDLMAKINQITSDNLIEDAKFIEECLFYMKHKNVSKGFKIALMYQAEDFIKNLSAFIINERKES